MKKNNLSAFLFLVFIISTCSIAQNKFQGTAEYFSKTDVDMSRFKNGNFSEEQKKRMQERMTKMFQKEYILVFNATESIFKIKEKLEAPGQKGGGRFAAMMSGATDGNRYKNIQKREMLKDAELLGKKFLIKDTLPKIAWKMTRETKKIGPYTCYKAAATRTIKDVNMRPKKKDKKEPYKIIDKEINVIAWYTPQIPISNGPQEYWGLPGLILELNADKTTILCSKVTLNQGEKIEIKKPKKGKKVTEDEFAEISGKKFFEMRQNFRKRRAQNQNNRNRR